MSIDSFVSRIEKFDEMSQSGQIDYFVFYITEVVGEGFATVASVNKCFEECDLVVPKYTASRMSQKLGQKPPKLVKVGSGYKLHRSRKKDLAEELEFSSSARSISHSLRKLEGRISEGAEREFLREAIDCLEIGASRATVMMTWLLAISNLQSHVVSNKLEEFNSALAKRSERSLKGLIITTVDDFSEMKESVFIEICRSAKIITNDVRKILDQKLGIRNTAAHPSSVMVRESKVIDFVEDLTDNVIAKFPALGA